MKFNTKVIHGNQHHEEVTGAVMPPVFQTSTYAQTSPGKPVGDYEYSRAANPTRQALEDALASIENGARGLAFASGLAATDCLVRMFKAGDEVIAMDDLYGGTYRSLFDASTYVRSIEERQGQKIGCIEEVAWRNGWIDDKKLISIAEKYKNNEYGEYLTYILQNDNV